MYYDNNFAIIIPVANEANELESLYIELIKILDRLRSGKVYFIVDEVSVDNTLEVCQTFSKNDSRFIAIWAPENKNIVDAYLRGYREAYDNGHDIIIEMDAGLSHDPRSLPHFIRMLNEGNECAFGCRFINGGSIYGSSFRRRVLSRGGTLLANILLGSAMKDMTSGYQGFHKSVVGEFLNYKLLSQGHFYQTELRYLLRYKRYAEVPIHYRAPSPNVSFKSIKNSIIVLFVYFIKRLSFKAQSIP